MTAKNKILALQPRTDKNLGRASWSAFHEKREKNEIYAYYKAPLSSYTKDKSGNENRDRRRKPKINRMRMRMRIKCECTVLRTYTMEWNGTSEIIVLQHIRRNDVQRCYSVNSACFLFFFSLSLFLSFGFFHVLLLVLLSFCVFVFCISQNCFACATILPFASSFVCFSLFQTSCRCRCLETNFGCMQLYHYHWELQAHFQASSIVFMKPKLNAIFLGCIVIL